MKDPADLTPSTSLASRKLIITAAVVLGGVTAFALYIGRTPMEPRRVIDDPPEFGFIKKPADSGEANYGDWFETSSDSTGSKPGAGEKPDIAAVHPTDFPPDVSPAPAADPAPPAHPVIAANDPAPPSVPEAASTEASSSMPSAAVPIVPVGEPARKKSGPALTSAPGGEASERAATVVPTPSTLSAPATAAGTNPPVAPATAIPAIATQPPPSAPGAGTAPAASPHVTVHRTPSVASVSEGVGNTAAPELKKPRSFRPGIVAHSAGLITPEQVAAATGTPAATHAAATKPATVSSIAFATTTGTLHTEPARVTLPEAKAYTARTTEALRRAGSLSPTQTMRIPRAAETSNTKVWRYDDTPVTPQETRPFGIVVEETDPAARAALAADAAAAPPQTPERIPLRTDIPEGTSPLQKSGPDKPLWKRP